MCTIDVQENGCSPPRKCTAKYVYTLMRYTQREILGLKLLGDLRGGEVQQDQLREAWYMRYGLACLCIQLGILHESIRLTLMTSQCLALGRTGICLHIPTFILDYYLQSKHNLDNYIRNVFWAFFDEQPKNILNSKMPDLQYDEETQSEHDYDLVINDQFEQNLTNLDKVKQQIDYKRSEFFILKVLLLASFTLLGWMLAMAAYLKYIFKLLHRDFKWFKRQLQAKRFVNYKKSQQYKREIEYQKETQVQN
eukprot:403341196